jgi:hypothetical protein
MFEQIYAECREHDQLRRAGREADMVYRFLEPPPEAKPKRPRPMQDAAPPPPPEAAPQAPGDTKRPWDQYVLVDRQKQANKKKKNEDRKRKGEKLEKKKGKLRDTFN